MEEKQRILIVDDDLALLQQLKWALQDEFEVITACSVEEATDKLKNHQLNVVILDVNLNQEQPLERGGLEILQLAKQQDMFIKVIMITGDDTKQVALEAISKGAFDFYRKPVAVEELKVMIRRAIYIQNLERENQRLQEAVYNKAALDDMVGSSEQMENVFGLIRKIAPTDATVLITGESGTGKELVAKAIHSLSPRKNNPFVVINCGAIPENLLESELFGHEKGAFTDAYIQRKGKLELANAGTVFLDEIGEMSLNLQVKMLRFLQERVIERVGGNTPIELDVRVIAATNANLEEKIKQGLFREDLFYRLSVITINLPALRERGQDIILLAQYFLQRYTKEMGKKNIKGFSRQTLDIMLAYSWPGNVREMENKIKRAVILAENSYISPEELGFEMERRNILQREKLSLRQARQQLEIRMIKKAIKDSKGNLSLAAKMLGITRPTLYDLMKKYNINATS